MKENFVEEDPRLSLLLSACVDDDQNDFDDDARRI